jgi:ferredoxin-NADP reductase
LIDAALLKSVSVDLSAAIYYVAGPPALVEAMRQMLNGAGVDDDDIRSEDFYGY